MRVRWHDVNLRRNKCATGMLSVVQIKEGYFSLRLKSNALRSWSYSDYFLDVDFLSISKHSCPHSLEVTKGEMLFNGFKFVYALKVRLNKELFRTETPCFLLFCHLYIYLYNTWSVYSLWKEWMNKWMNG